MPATTLSRQDGRRDRSGLHPRGYLSLREAVIRLAEATSPEAEIRAYLTPPAEPPALHSILGGVNSLGAELHAAFSNDPFEWPNPPGSAWEALEAARAELRRRLEAREMAASVVLKESGHLRPVKVNAWRTYRGYVALRTGKLAGCVVLLVEAGFARSRW